MNESKVEELDPTPLNAKLKEIAALKNVAELPGYMARVLRHRPNSKIPIDLGLKVDAKNSANYLRMVCHYPTAITTSWTNLPSSTPVLN